MQAGGSSQSFSTSVYIPLNDATVAGNPASVLRAYQSLCEAEVHHALAADLHKKDDRKESKPRKTASITHPRISLRKQQVLRLQALRASKVAEPSAAAAHQALAAKYGQEGSMMLEADQQRRAIYKPRRLLVGPSPHFCNEHPCAC